MHELALQIKQAVEVVRSHWAGAPHAGIILGTGLGSVAGQIQIAAKLDYAEIPHFPRSTAIGHAGQLVCGKLQGLPVVAMEGRFHAYEGYTYKQITFPVRAMRPWAELAFGLQRLRRAESAIRPRRYHGDRRSYQPDGRQSAYRPE